MSIRIRWQLGCLGMLLAASAFVPPELIGFPPAEIYPMPGRPRGAVTLTPEALAVHRQGFVFDGHNDLPWALREQADPGLTKLDLAQPQPALHTDIPRLRQGNVGAQFWSVYVPAETARTGDALQQTLEQIHLVRRMAERYPETFELASTADDIVRIQRQGKIASLIGVEGGHSIQNSLGTLRQLHQLGARYMTLTHSETTDWADSATDEPRHGGLSEFGEDVVREMNRLGMLVDVSHVSLDTLRDAVRVSRAPVIASHSSAYSVAQHPRNIPDAEIRAIAAQGGVVMVNFSSIFDEPSSARNRADMFKVRRRLEAEYPVKADFDRAYAAWQHEHPVHRGNVHTVVDHINRIHRLVGIDHIGLGSDYDGVAVLPEQLEDVSKYPYITQVLLDLGYKPEDINKILSGNILRVMRDAEQVSRQLQVAAAEVPPAKRHPNIIYVLADDLGYGDLGCYGQKRIQTPQIDRMASEGMRFTNFYSGSTVCAPSRCVLMTGLHTGHCFIRGNARDNLRPADVTVAEMLKDAGYATGLVGKWGLGHEGSDGVPTRQGFDSFFGYLDQHHAHNYYPAFLMRNDQRVALRNEVPEGPNPFGTGVATKKLDYTPDLMAAEALKFIDEHQKSPFFLYLALTTPHANNEARSQGMEVPDVGPYKNLDWPEPQKAHAAMISRMDADLGRIFARLKQLGIDEETVVFFSSDNGPHREGGNDPDFNDSNGPLRGIKRDLTEGGIRVPMIVRWPGHVPAGKTSDHIGYFGDVMATLADLAGVRAPQGLDSLSFLPACLNRPDDQRQHPYLYWEFYEKVPSQAVRMGRWKAIRKPMPVGKIQLYDLDNDVGESQDFAAEHPEILQRMEAAMNEAHTPSDRWKVPAVRTSAPKTTDKARRPNVVLVMTDDQGYGDLGCLGNTMVRTPNIDRFHAESVRLANFHVDPTCSPTRSSLMTGRYSSRTGVWHTIMGRSIMRRDEVTMADVFAAAGYRTGIFGKWHLGDNYPSRPQDRGFGESLIFGGGGITQTPDYWGNDYFDDTYLHNGKPEPSQGYCTDVWFREATRFIEQNKDEPFFCYIPTNAAHSPYNVDEKYSRPYVDKGVPDTMARFYGMIGNIDENFGRLLAKLDELKLADDTIVIYMTDNGTAAGYTQPSKDGQTLADAWRGYNAGMRGIKGSEYDGGHRVPCFIRWPGGRITGGRDVAPITAHIDLLPTLAELSGATIPNPGTIDGRSLVPLLHGEAAWPDRTLLVHSQRIDQPEKWRKSAVMTDRWRLVNGQELYDLPADPGQTNDLAEKHPEKVAELRKQYDAWWDSISTRFKEHVPIVIGSAHENPARITCHDWHPTQGDLPVMQSSIAKSPNANGYWTIEVRETGTYEFELRSRPAEVVSTIPKGKARLKVGELEFEQPIPAESSHVTFRVKLPAGAAMMQTWLDEENGKSRGAFFVYAKRIVGE